MPESLSEPEMGWLASRFARLSTGIKMLLILSLGLLPLGLIAVFASLDSARQNQAKRITETREQLERSALRLDGALIRGAFTVRVASAALATAPADTACQPLMQQLASAQVTMGRFALYDPAGGLRCASPGFTALPIPPNPDRRPVVTWLTPDGSAVQFTAFDEEGRLAGVGEFRREALARRLDDIEATQRSNLELVGGDRRMTLHARYQEGAPLVQDVVLSQPIAAGQLQLRIAAGAVPISAVDAIMILLPVMMWIFAAIIGWVIVDRLLLKPLVRMQRSVAAYRPGEPGLDLPTFSSPAREIGDLGHAFNNVTRTVARHEAELEAGIERQTRLVREVHHRVKNNLQVVASLINLHARGAKNEDVAAAYASIQRRVDALAVVHRNHFAELEENRGVALKPLIAELATNLRATAPASAAQMQIRLDIAPLHTTQDTALSIAFFLTELIEFAMFCGARSAAVTLDPMQDGRAQLSVEAEALKGQAECDPRLSTQFERIISGLARQLRSVLDHDTEAGRYAVGVNVLDRGPDGA